MQTGLFEEAEVVDPSFEEFWERYQKKVSKRDAIKAWAKLKPKLKREILDSNIIEQYVESTPNKKYRLHASTWLNGEHWEDEIITDNKSGISNGVLGQLAATSSL